MVLSIVSCQYMEKRTAQNLPMLRKMMASKDVDDDTVRQGLYDGCVTGAWTRGNSFNRTFLRMRYDTALMKNKKYTVAWSRAYGLCFLETNQNSFQQIGQKIVGQSPGSYINYRNSDNGAFPIGGTADTAGHDFLFSENIDKGLPNNQTYGSSNESFFGVFGSGGEVL